MLLILFAIVYAQSAVCFVNRHTWIHYWLTVFFVAWSQGEASGRTCESYTGQRPRRAPTSTPWWDVSTVQPLQLLCTDEPAAECGSWVYTDPSEISARVGRPILFCRFSFSQTSPTYFCGERILHSSIYSLLSRLATSTLPDTWPSFVSNESAWSSWSANRKCHRNGAWTCKLPAAVKRIHFADSEVFPVLLIRRQVVPGHSCHETGHLFDAVPSPRLPPGL